MRTTLRNRLASAYNSTNNLHQCSSSPPPVGLVLGTYVENEKSLNPIINLTPTAEKYDSYMNGKLFELLKISGPVPSRYETRVLYGIDPTFPIIGVVGLGPECMGYDDVEQRDENKERIREAAGSASRTLQKTSKVESIYVESFGHAESSAEGAAMAVWLYQEHKKQADREIIPKLFLFDNCDAIGWKIGLHKAAGQNLVRQLCDSPPNVLTPQTFAQHMVRLLNTAGVNVEMKVGSWLKMVGMKGLLAAGRGSCYNPILMEASYYGCDPDVCPIMLIGKGVTCDTGGMCLKSTKDMAFMRNDMAGAACVVAALRTASALHLPINIRALIPLCENMLGPKSIKPGDIVDTLHGKSVKVCSTDTESRLCMLDMLTYANIYKPKLILDIGTMSKDMPSGVGCAATGVWSTSDSLWEQMRVASIHTGDRVWRFPIWKHYQKCVQSSPTSDVKDVDCHLGGPNLAAALLNEFVCSGDWMHMDIYGVTRSNGKENHYLSEGMSGRPTRTLIEFLAQFACVPPDDKKQSSKHKIYKCNPPP